MKRAAVRTAARFSISFLAVCAKRIAQARGGLQYESKHSGV